jgi:SlyX protein
MADAPEDRLTQIEAHLAHVERLCDDLNGVVTGQARELDRLKRQVARLTESLEGLETERIKSTNAKPPHYQ